MSVIGISPTDIVKTARVLKDGATALTSGEDGAKQQLQNAQATSAALVTAVEELASSSEVVPDSAYTALVERERRFQAASLAPYGKRLGTDSRAGPLATMKRKLQYAFDGEMKVQKHVVASKPGVDAVVLHTMRGQNDLATRQHAQTIETIRDGFTAMAKRSDAVGPDVAGQLSRAVEALPKEQSDAVAMALRAHWGEAKVDLARLIERAVRAGVVDGLQSREESRDIRSIHQAGAYISQDRYCGVGARSNTEERSWDMQQRYPQRSPSAVGEQIHDGLFENTHGDRPSVAAKLLWCLLSASMAALYQHPSVRKALAACLPRYHRDPMSVTLLLITLLTFTNCFVSLPLQMCLWSDNSIFLDTALEEPLRVPKYY